MYYSKTKRCTASISVKRNRLKQYEDTVYLKNGQSFEIELFNPQDSPVLAKISVNGKTISNSGIVIKPGQRIYLERFIDEAKKFKFETYEIEDSEEARAATLQNGRVEVEFYYEAVNRFQTSHLLNYDFSNSAPHFITNTTTNYREYSGLVSSTYAGTTINYCSAPVAGSIETGRVEAGASSNQAFTNYYGNFNWRADERVTIKIKPTSAKPIESGEIRNYCPNCGSRIKKSSWNFCPGCGTSLA